MNNENQLLEKFQVEELEKRYEFAWHKSSSGPIDVEFEGSIEEAPTPNDPLGPYQSYPAAGMTISW